MSFADHFSAQAGAYGAFRPSYPDALGAFLAAVAPARGLVWDCASGSGQAATMLARHFDRVAATDASAGQIGEAAPHERIDYRVAPADASGLPDHSCDVVTVAQAAHWFHLAPFYAESRRVLKPGGIIALWCYVLAETGHPDVNEAIRRFQYDRLGRHWPPGRELVDDRYRLVPFPFTAVPTPEFAMTATWTRADLLGYVGTWSAVARCRKVEGLDPMQDFAAELTRLWPDAATPTIVSWPLYTRIGVIPSPHEA